MKQENDQTLRHVLSDVALEWNHDELYGAFISLIHQTKDMELTAIFEAELMEIGYLEPIEDDEM